MRSTEILLTGDLILDEPDPDHWLGGISPRLREASLVIGHLEVPHTRRGEESPDDVPAPAADPDHLSALKRAGFGVVTLAGNHIADRGSHGIADTVAELDRLGIAHAGAGADLELARAPAYRMAGDFRIAVLSYNCVGPESGWAAPGRAGCAYVRVDTEDGSPIRPAAALTTPAPESVASLAADIGSASRQADAVIVALHKGVVHTPVVILPYERALARAAIDAGADVVVGHHAHILRGIEWYRAKPIYHGLGNGCVVTRALSPAQDHAARAAWARERRTRFGFEPDPAYPLAPFHPEAIHSLLARLKLRPDGLEAGYLPVYVEPPGRPVLAADGRSTAVVDYLSRITTAAGLPALQQRAVVDGILLT